MSNCELMHEDGTNVHVCPAWNRRVIYRQRYQRSIQRKESLRRQAEERLGSINEWSVQVKLERREARRAALGIEEEGRNARRRAAQNEREAMLEIERRAFGMKAIVRDSKS